MVMKPVTFSWVDLNLNLFGRKFLIQKFDSKVCYQPNWLNQLLAKISN